VNSIFLQNDREAGKKNLDGRSDPQGGSKSWEAEKGRIPEVN